MDRLLANEDEWADSADFIDNVNSTTALSHIGEIDIQYSSNKHHPDHRVAWFITEHNACFYAGYIEE